jgi:hypothetical protein
MIINPAVDQGFNLLSLFCSYHRDFYVQNSHLFVSEEAESFLSYSGSALPIDE